MRIVAYALTSAAGVLTFIQVFDFEGINRPLWWGMASWLAVGGLLACLGQAFRRWTGEFVGLPLIGSAFLGFTLLQINLYGLVAQLSSHFLLTSFALVVLSRWRDVYALYRASLHLATEGPR